VRISVDAAAKSFLPLEKGVLCPWQLWTVKK